MKRIIGVMMAVMALAVVAVGVHFGMSGVDCSGMLAVCVDWLQGFTMHTDGLAGLSAALPLVGIKELRKKRAGLIGEARAILDGAEGGTLSAEQQERWDAAMQEVDALQSRIDREERQHDAEQSLEERSRVQAAVADPAAGSRGENEQRAKYSAAFRSYLLHGANGLSAEERQVLGENEQRAQSAGTNTAGGFTVPDEAMAAIERAQKEFGGVREAATVISTESGADLPIPTVNDTANTGRWLGEGAAVTATDTTFGQVVMKAHKAVSDVIVVSYELLQDSGVNIEQLIGELLGERIARLQNAAFTTGTGTGQPTGIVAGAALGKTGATGQTASITYDDVVDLVHSVDPYYRRQGRFMAADSSIRALKKLKDSTGQPLWAPGVAVREPDTLLGFGFTVNQDMPSMAANAKSILFGDLRKYRIREVKGFTLIRLNELYAGNLQVGFIGFARTDGKLIDAGTNPVKYYANSAT